MKKFISIVRLAVAFTLVSVCIVLLVAEVNEDTSISRYILMFVLSKGAGFLCGYVTYLLFKLWRNDLYISRLMQMCDEE